MTPDLFTDRSAKIQRLERYIHASIPLAVAMGITVGPLDDSGLYLKAPLPLNRNHIGTAFGGSIASLSTLAGWGLLWLVLEDLAGAHIVVHDCQMHYLHPVAGELVARCPLPADDDLAAFRKTLVQRGRARFNLSVDVLTADSVCATFQGRFVARKNG